MTDLIYDPTLRRLCPRCTEFAGAEKHYLVSRTEQCDGCLTPTQRREDRDLIACLGRMRDVMLRQWPQNSGVVSDVLECAFTLEAFQKRLVEELQALRSQLKHAKAAGMEEAAATIDSVVADWPDKACEDGSFLAQHLRWEAREMRADAKTTTP